jgi:signal transduction histidine kinase
VFEPFQQLDAVDGRRGSGLGLAIARAFAEANGGHVWIDSPSGAGAAFNVAFPLASAVAQVEP